MIEKIKNKARRKEKVIVYTGKMKRAGKLTTI